MRSTAWILRAVGVTKAGKVSLHGRPYQRASSAQRLRHSQARRELPGLADDSCAVHHPALRRNWQQTLQLG
jgi:hypothetical protein